MTLAGLLAPSRHGRAIERRALQAAGEAAARAARGTSTPLPIAKRVVEITAADLPLACPLVGDPVGFAHPRVYLEIVNGHEALCPYCGTLYRLKPGQHLNDHRFGACDLHQHREAYPTEA